MHDTLACRSPRPTTPPRLVLIASLRHRQLCTAIIPTVAVSGHEGLESGLFGRMHHLTWHIHGLQVCDSGALSTQTWLCAQPPLHKPLFHDPSTHSMLLAHRVWHLHLMLCHNSQTHRYELFRLGIVTFRIFFGQHGKTLENFYFQHHYFARRLGASYTQRLSVSRFGNTCMT